MDVEVRMVNYNLEGPAWSDLTVTWSFATANFLGQPSTFDAFLSPGVFKSEIVAALADWQQYSTLKFVQAADSANVDIRFGYSHFDGPFGILGGTNYFYSGDNFLPDVTIRFDMDEQYSPVGGHPQLSSGVT